MTLPKKGLRKITVEDMQFAWNATGNDGRIGLTVAPLDNQGQLLRTSFSYHKVIKEGVREDGGRWQNIKQQLIVTPYIVRQVIEYGLQNGWNPTKKGPQLYIDVDDKIDLRIEE